GLTCPHCGEPIDMFAGSQRLSDAGVPVLGRIPFDVQLSVTADQGRPLVLGDPRGPVAYEFARVGAAVRRWVSGAQDAPRMARGEGRIANGPSAARIPPHPPLAATGVVTTADTPHNRHGGTTPHAAPARPAARARRHGRG